MQRTLSAVPLAVAGLAAVSAGWQAVASRRDNQRFPPPGRLVDVEGTRLHVHMSGNMNAAPAVVLEAGMASMSSNWGWVRQSLASDGLVVTYDRAGLGWSDPATGPVDAASSAEMLHAVLAGAQVPPPYVLAGHSYGGLVTRMFTDTYPDEVVGMVLVDASHPDQWANIPASFGGRTVALGNCLSAALAIVGVLRLAHTEKSFIQGLPSQEYAEMQAYLARPQGWLAGARGLLAWADSSREQVNATRDLDALPLIVLSVTEQARYADVLTELQDELATLSRNSRHITVTGATHYTLVSEHEYADIVADAIRTVVASARTGRPVADAGAPEPRTSA